VRFRFIEDRRTDYPVTILCDVLGVSPAGYYAWRSRPESERSAANRELFEDIRRVHRDTSGRYGSPRIHAELKAQGRGASRGRIERLMRHHGIRAIMARPQRVRTTDSRHDFPIAPNLLERNFIANAPNRIWLADITYVETDQGWLYLATVLDLYSRRIVGWAMADRLRADLPLAALRMAISAQQPGTGLIHHSDRGVQYASAEYRKVIRSAGFRASMSARVTAMTMPRWRASSTRSKPNSSIIGNMQHGQKPNGISLLTSKASTIELGATRPSATSARSRWS
jgi:putative transposase